MKRTHFLGLLLFFVVAACTNPPEEAQLDVNVLSSPEYQAFVTADAELQTYLKSIPRMQETRQQFVQAVKQSPSYQADNPAANEELIHAQFVEHFGELREHLSRKKEAFAALMTKYPHFEFPETETPTFD